MASMGKHGSLKTSRSTFELSRRGRALLVSIARDRSKAVGHRVPMVTILEEAIRLLAEQEARP
jgi:hypothetical protein